MYRIPALMTELIGYFSIDGDSQYRADLSQLKYYVPPADFDNVNFNLDINLASIRHTPTSRVKLDNVLKWISENFHRIERPLPVQEERWLDIDFVSSRGTLRTILCSSYNNHEWIICACKYRGTIYLCEFDTEGESSSQAGATTSEKQIPSWGYKFEQYMVADHPSHKPDPLVPHNKCEKFHCMFKANIGNHSLLYSAKIDGIFSQQPITDTLVGKTFELIGLKTLRMYSGNMRSAAPDVILRCWGTNYLVQTNKIVVGFRNASNTVKTIKEYSTDGLLKLSRSFCNVSKCKIFFKAFLDSTKEVVTKDHNKCIYKFHWKPSEKEMVTYCKENPNNDMILKSWFVDKAEEYRRAQ